MRALRPSRSAELFLLAWMLPSWVVFELISTKLPHYTMPLYPAVALMSARMVLALAGRPHQPRVGEWFWVLIGGVLLVVAGRLVFPQHGFDPTTRLLLMPLGYVVLLIATWRMIQTARLLFHRRVLDAQIEAILVALLLFFAFHFCALPQNIVISRGILEARTRMERATERPFAAVGYHEDSLVFLTRGRVERIDAPSMDAWAAAHPDGILVFPAALLDSSKVGELARGPSSKFSVGGFNYSNGEHLHLLVVDLQSVNPQ